MGVGIEENPGRVGERSGDAWNKIAHRAERRDLLGVERVARLLRAGEVAHHEIDAGASRDLARVDGGQIFNGKPEPVDARIDVKRGRALPAGARPKRFPFRELSMLPMTGPQVFSGKGRQVAGSIART